MGPWWGYVGPGYVIGEDFRNGVRAYRATPYRIVCHIEPPHTRGPRAPPMHKNRATFRAGERVSIV